MMAWASKPENYGEFLTKLWGKGAIKGPTIDTADVILERMTQGENARLINPESATAADILGAKLDAISRRTTSIIDAEPA